jgi:hypothetical protein
VRRFCLPLILLVSLGIVLPPMGSLHTYVGAEDHAHAVTHGGHDHGTSGVGDGATWSDNGHGGDRVIAAAHGSKQPSGAKWLPLLLLFVLALVGWRRALPIPGRPPDDIPPPLRRSCRLPPLRGPPACYI